MRIIVVVLLFVGTLAMAPRSRADDDSASGADLDAVNYADLAMDDYVVDYSNVTVDGCLDPVNADSTVVRAGVSSGVSGAE